VIPLGILVFFSKVDAVNTTYKEPVDFLVPGVLALAVMSSAMVSLGIATGTVREVRPGDYLVEVAATPAMLAAVTAWLAEQGALLSELRAGRRSLEDVFLRLTGEGRS
jgi:hypothetical protein